MEEAAVIIRPAAGIIKVSGGGHSIDMISPWHWQLGCYEPQVPAGI